ncbi:hypothetical protein EJ08DRAFT_645318 [Tothia fuscella]|uniref:Uncharacterized protein n=1 Tax=Tothia fuscella TaxID=1048955 RepID=A0A9P4U2C3_9PEZI|nr:hypothetical protein EJ08DRAFT_645318 [Tothia fuscella]
MDEDEIVWESSWEPPTLQAARRPSPAAQVRNTAFASKPATTLKENYLPNPQAKPFVIKGPVVQVDISPQADFTILYNRRHYFDRVTKARTASKPNFHFKISKAVLATYSKEFKDILNVYSYSKATEYNFEKDNMTAMEVVLKVLHSLAGQDVGVQDTYKIKLKKVWHVAEILRKYQIDKDLFKEWFAEWYQRLDHTNKAVCEELLFPTWHFSHGVGVAKATRMAVMDRVGTVVDKNPLFCYPYWKHPEYSWMHLPKEVVKELSNTKEYLRRQISVGLWFSIDYHVDRDDDCCEVGPQTKLEYERALRRLGAWPPDRATRDKTLKSILDELPSFTLTPPATCCQLCASPPSCPRRLGYKGTVDLVCTFFATAFQGLCLHCMQLSLMKEDDEYWFLDKNKVWGRDCAKHGGFTHGSGSWYRSYMSSGRSKGIAKFGGINSRPNPFKTR